MREALGFMALATGPIAHVFRAGGWEIAHSIRPPLVSPTARKPALWKQKHHRLARRAQHNIAFWHELGIDPLPICERLYAQRGDLVAMRAVILVAIAERG